MIFAKAVVLNTHSAFVYYSPMGCTIETGRGVDVSGHTVTFGTEPPDVTPQTPPSTNVFCGC
jgi:hypothetical protein